LIDDFIALTGKLKPVHDDIMMTKNQEQELWTDCLPLYNLPYRFTSKNVL